MDERWSKLCSARSLTIQFRIYFYLPHLESDRLAKAACQGASLNRESGERETGFYSGSVFLLASTDRVYQTHHSGRACDCRRLTLLYRMILAHDDESRGDCPHISRSIFDGALQICPWKSPHRGDAFPLERHGMEIESGSASGSTWAQATEVLQQEVWCDGQRLFHYFQAAT